MQKYSNKKMFVVAIVVILLDYITKFIASKYLLHSGSVCLIPSFLYFTLVDNTGVAFSFLEGRMVLIIICTVVILGGIVKYTMRQKMDMFSSLAYGFIIGGAVGNLIDRIVRGYVIDFIDIYIFGYNYPIFNIADIAVVVGVCMLLFVSFKKEGG